jgi:hypothetical protein
MPQAPFLILAREKLVQELQTPNCPLETAGEYALRPRAASRDQQNPTAHFSDLTVGAASARAYVDARPIKGDFERHWYCQAWQHKNCSFHGIPADNTSDATWLFETRNAHFQLDVWIPGVLEPPHSSPLQLTPVPTATPLPQATVTADQTIIATILGSFQPANTAPLSCS